MENTKQLSYRQKVVFDKYSRENYFERLNQALTNLSIVDAFKEKKIQRVKSKVSLQVDHVLQD